MTTGKIITLGLSFINLVAGITFGILGHFFSICCFPFLAVLQGIVTVFVMPKGNENRTFKKTLLASAIGAVAFYIGMNIGVLILIFVLVPNSPELQESLGESLSNPYGMAGGIGGGLICGLMYGVIYMVVAAGTAALTQKLRK